MAAIDRRTENEFCFKMAYLLTIKFEFQAIHVLTLLSIAHNVPATGRRQGTVREAQALGSMSASLDAGKRQGLNKMGLSRAALRGLAVGEPCRSCFGRTGHMLLAPVARLGSPFVIRLTPDGERAQVMPQNNFFGLRFPFPGVGLVRCGALPTMANTSSSL